MYTNTLRVSPLFLLVFTTSTILFFTPLSKAHAAALIGHWALDETVQGTTTIDTGGSNNGTPSGTGGGPSPSTTTPTVTFSDPGSYQFNGSNQYVQIASQFTSAVSVTFWFNPHANGSGNGASDNWYGGTGLFDAEIGGVTNDFGVTWTGNRVLFGIGNPDVTIRSSALALDTWHHVAATWQKSNGAMKLYIDGVLVATSTGSLNDRISTNVRFGVLLSGVNSYYNGYMDDIRTYDVALDQSQIESMASGNSITDVISLSLSPADNATSVATSTALSLTFGTSSVSTSTGVIRLFKTSDNSLVESFALNSSRITRSTSTASTTFSISPTALTESTGYYLSIASTTFQYGNGNFWEGTISSTTWNFTTGDFTSPVLSAIAATSTASTTASITWTSNESASSRVVYGLTASYSTTTTETDTSPRVTSHTKALSGLLGCTTYHYAVVSRDATLNAATSSDNSFTTIGCTGSSTPVAATSTSITSSSGGSTSVTDSGKTLTVTLPANATATSSSMVIQVQAIGKSSVISELGTPAAAPNTVGLNVFDVKAIINGGTILDSFDAEVTISYEYSDSDISGLNESSLWLYHYHNGTWSRLNSCTVNTTANTISCTTPAFSVFGLFGQTASSGSSLSSSGGIHYGCQDSKASNYDFFSHHKQSLCTYTSAQPATGSVCTPRITSYIQLGAKNNAEDVKKLETFLNEKQGEKLAVDGVYSPEDAAAVKRFQKKYASEVLGIWGLSAPTGYVYRTTLMKINSFYCSEALTCPAFTEFNDTNENTSSAEIQRTKTLLKELGFYSGAINTNFDAPLKASLAKFQETFSETMLKPWGLTHGTGYKYKTTNKFLNLIVGCKTPAVSLDGKGVFDY